jgi:hypothetical protein
METAERTAAPGRRTLGFLTRATKNRDMAVAAALALVAAALAAGCGRTRPLTGSPGDGGQPGEGGATGTSGAAGSSAAGAAGAGGAAGSVSGGGGDRPTNPDGGASCANIGCGAPPLCSLGCQERCGCCPCTPGERNGNLVCTSAGCFAPTSAPDAGSDGGWSPAPACALPFDPGSCDGTIIVWAFVNGACVQEGYSGCAGNGNRFQTLEECLATCAGQPDPFGCPADRVPARICLECGPAGGCAKLIDVCGEPCGSSAAASLACPTALPYCFAGVCELGGCE